MSVTTCSNKELNGVTTDVDTHPSGIDTNYAMSSSSATVAIIKNEPYATESNSSKIDSNIATIEAAANVDVHTEFTRQWIKPFLISGDDDTTAEQKQLLLKSVFCDTKVGEENVLMKLIMDYEFEPGVTVLALILYYFCLDPYETDPSLPRMIVRDPKRSGFKKVLVNNLRRHGYAVLSSFDWNRLGAVTGRWNRDIGQEGNILTLLLVVLESGQWDMTGQEEKEFIRFIEEVIRTILEQPTLTKEMKSKFVNEFRKTFGDKINPLGTIGNHGSSYLSLCRLLLSHGADIHASEDGTPSPLLNACLNRHVELVLEMILSQENLLAIDLNQKCRSNESISSAFTTEFAVNGTDGTNVNTTDSFRGVRCSTPIKLLKRIGRRLYQWQEGEKKQLALNSAYQPNDVEIRQWLREQLTSLSNHLFATTIQQAMHQPLLTSGQPPDHRESCHRDYLRRWIHQLQTAPLSINLLEVPPNLLVHHTFLVDSFDLFLEPEFAPYVPQLLSLLDESHLSFIDGLVLFGEYVPIDYLDDIFKSISPLLTCDKLIGEKGAYQQNFLLQLMDVCMERLSHVIQVYQSESWKNNSDYLVQLRLAYGYDSTDTTHNHGLSTVLSKSLEHINNEVPNILLGLAREIGSSCSIEVFRTLWTSTLPRLEHFRLKEFSYRSEMLYQLIRSTLMNENERPMERLQSFLTDPFFFTSDLWEPFQMDRANDSSQDLNLVEIVKKLNVRVGEWVELARNDDTERH